MPPTPHASFDQRRHLAGIQPYQRAVLHSNGHTGLSSIRSLITTLNPSEALQHPHHRIRHRLEHIVLSRTVSRAAAERDICILCRDQQSHLAFSSSCVRHEPPLWLELVGIWPPDLRVEMNGVVCDQDSLAGWDEAR